MKIRLTPQQLAKQLPKLRRSILKHYADDVILSGKPTDRSKRMARFAPEKRYRILRDHPELLDLLPSRQLEIASALWRRRRTVEDLGIEIYESGVSKIGKLATANLVYVMLRNLRNTLAKHRLPLSLTKSGRKPKYIMLVASPSIEVKGSGPDLPRSGQCDL
jgi:hypothetical protein